MPSPVEHLQGRAMASDTEIVVVGAPAGALRWAAARIDQLEQRWSRFLPHSDISRLNDAEGATVVVHPDTLCLLSAMTEGVPLSGGIFDPRCVAVEDRAGEHAEAVTVTPRPALEDEVIVDLPAGSARLAPGVALDPGAIGKGLAADLVVAELRRMGCAGALVGIGGDLAMSGASPGGGPWSIGVADAWGGTDEPIASVEIEAGGVATSSTLYRRGEQRGTTRTDHVDPRTATAPAGGELVSVTIVARSGWAAEVHATTALLGGMEAAEEHIRTHGLTGVLQSAGSVVVVQPGVSEVRS
jgi:thiamine biosynthesis lipoprotein